MKSLFISLFVRLMTVVYTSFPSNIPKFHKNQDIIDSNDQGQAENCGKYNFTLTWSPKVINVSKPFTVAFSMVAPMDIDKGAGFIEVWIFGQPILQYVKGGSCSDVAKVVPSLKCPIKKGDSLVYKQTFNIPKAPTLGTSFAFLVVANYSIFQLEGPVAIAEIMFGGLQTTNQPRAQEHDMTSPKIFVYRLSPNR